MTTENGLVQSTVLRWREGSGVAGQEPERRTTFVAKLAARWVPGGRAALVPPDPLVAYDERTTDPQRVGKAGELAPILPCAALLVAGAARVTIAGPLGPRVIESGAAVGVGISMAAATRARFAPAAPTRGDDGLLVIPPTLDARFFHAAPEQQHLPLLRGSESLTIETAQTRLETSLPGMVVVATVRNDRSEERRLVLAIDMLVVDVARAQMSLVGRASVRGAFELVHLALSPIESTGTSDRGDMRRHRPESRARIDAVGKVAPGGLADTAPISSSLIAAVRARAATPFQSAEQETAVMRKPAPTGRPAGSQPATPFEGFRGARVQPAAGLERTLTDARPLLQPLLQPPLQPPPQSPAAPPPARALEDEGTSLSDATTNDLPPDPQVRPLPLGPLPVRVPTPAPLAPAPLFADPGPRDPRVDAALARLAGGEKLDGIDLHGLDMRGVSFAGGWLENANLSRADLRGASFEGARLGRARLEGANLRGAKLVGAIAPDLAAREADFSGAILDGATLTSADLSGAILEDASARGVDASRANLERVAAPRADLTGANLTEARLARAQLEGAKLDGAQLGKADLRAANVTSALLERARLEGARARELRGGRAVMRGAFLAGADLERADLEAVVLDGANLDGAILRGAKLESASIRAAKLGRADLRDAELSGADLTDSDTSDARMRGARLNDTKGIASPPKDG